MPVKKDRPKYQAGKGTKAIGDDGIWHEITPDGVAKHPGDLGMKFIADAVYKVMQ